MVDFESNMALVTYVYNEKFKSYGYMRDDLMQEGYIGLHKACKSFDANKNFSFTTFAYSCIKNEMLMYLRKINKYREHEILGLEINSLSTDCEYNINRVLKNSLNEELLKLYIDGYSTQEISKKLNISPSNVFRALKKEKERIEENGICQV